MASIGIIINDKSDRTASVMTDLLYVTKRFSNVCTEVLDGVRGLGRALTSMNRQNVDTLILAGGDGTMQAVFTDVINNRRFEHAPNFVALPCGMTNVIANDCGLQGSPARSLDNFLWRSQKGDVKPLSRALLQIKPSDADPVYGFFVGAGGFCSAVEYSRNSIQSKGAKRSIALAASTVGYIAKVALNPEGSISPVELELLHTDGETTAPSERSDRLLYLSTTLSRLGNGIYPFWGTGEGPMVSTLVGYPAPRFIRAATRIVRAKSMPWFEQNGYHSWRSNTQTLSFDGHYVFDGEFFTAERDKPLVLETSKHANFLN
ncbi:MAG: diacylglycerol kinase family protein [Pseudomonadota bacterium]